MRISGLSAVAMLCGLAAGCGIYTFSGSSLPAYLKTVDIPLFVNESLQPGVAELITEELNRRVMSANQLRVVTNRGDGTISGTVTAYDNHPYTYASKAVREVNISEYAVRITAQVEFTDNKKSEAIYKGSVTGEGVYNFTTENEEAGKSRAIKDLTEQIVQNSVQGW